MEIYIISISLRKRWLREPTTVAESLPWAGIRMQKAITMHHHRHTAAVMESEQTAVTSAFMQTGLVGRYQEPNRTPHYYVIQSYTSEQK